MAEMALTADRLVVIGRGRLIADTTVEEFVASAATQHVVVRSSDQVRLADARLTPHSPVPPRRGTFAGPRSPVLLPSFRGWSSPSGPSCAPCAPP